MNNKGLELMERNGVKYYTSSLVDTNKIPHFFSTRTGGASEGCYSSLNLGIYTDDSLESVSENFSRIFSSAGMEKDKIVYLKQVHGDKFYIVDDINYFNINGKYGDAIITNARGIAIGVFTADCVSVLIADPIKNIIAAVHAGWKGTSLCITGKVLNYMINEMLCNPEDITVSIGPSIGPCCFEVKEDVANKFTYINYNEGKLYVDLWRENYSQALLRGVLPKNIAQGELCSVCNESLFYSYRRDKGLTGRLGSFIQIAKEA